MLYFTGTDLQVQNTQKRSVLLPMYKIYTL